MGISDKAADLAVAITGTKEFSELKHAKNIIDKNRELKSKVDDFRKKQEAMYTGKYPSNEMQQKAAELKKGFESLSGIPEINRFLKAEKDFNNMLQKIYKTISDTLESAL